MTDDFPWPCTCGHDFDDHERWADDYWACPRCACDDFRGAAAIRVRGAA